MAESSLESYREEVKCKLARAGEMLGRICLGDLSVRPDIDKLPDDEFLDLFCGLDMAMDDLAETRRVLQSQSRINLLRAEIWRLAADDELSREELIQKLLDTAGPFFSAIRATYFEFEPESRDAVAKIQWRSGNTSPSLGLSIPRNVYDRFLGEDSVVITLQDLPEPPRQYVGELFEKFNLGSFLALPFPLEESAQGFFALSSEDEQRKWSDDERGVITEIIQIVASRAARLKAEEAHRELMAQLERTVVSRTAELNRLNEQLRDDIARREQVEKRLKSSEREKRRMLDSLSELVVYQDTELRVQWANEAACQSLGLPREKLIGKHCYELWQSRNVPCDYCPVEAAIREESACLREMSDDGGKTWLVKGYPVRNPRGEVIGATEIARDITEEKEAARIRREADERFRAVAQNAHEAIISLDSGGRVAFWNAGAEVMFGYSAAEVSGGTLDTILREADRPVFEQYMRQLRDDGTIPHEGSTVEGVGVRRNGEQFPWELSISTWSTHRDRFMTLVVRDVTSRNKAETALRESEENYRTLVETSPDAIVVFDLNGKVTMVNQVAMEVRECNRKEELLGRDVYEMIAPRDRERAAANVALVLERGSLKNVEYALLRRDGTEFPGEISASLIRDAGGNPRGLTATVRDISARKASARELAEEKELVEVTLGSIANGVISTDTEGKIVFMNAVAEKLTGWTRGEATGSPVGQVVRLESPSSGNRVDSPVARVLSSKSLVGFTGEKALVARDGSSRIIHDSGSPLRDRKGNVLGAVMVFLDVTEQRQLENELFKARKLESVGLLAGGIAHDFNNILTGIVTNLFMAKMNLGEAGESKQLIMDAEKAAFRATRLTRQLLTFSKGGTPVKESASIGEIIEDAVGFCLSGSNCDYRLDLQEDLWAVEVDRGQVDQVINNLVINANQAMPDGGIITVKASNVEIEDRVLSDTASTLPLAPGKYVKVTVRDEGGGIPARDLERIFDPYFSTKPNGSGLGLTTAFSIVKKHGGHMTARSAIGKGSRFVFYLPASPQEDEEESGAEDELIPGTSHVLVMDDDEVVRTVVIRLLARNGYRVESAFHGREAIEKYRSAMEEGDPFDVVIMDLTVAGGMGGKDGVKGILEEDPDAKVIVFSGYSNDPVLANYREYGFSGVISKPFSIEEFSRIINRIINPEDATEGSSSGIPEQVRAPDEQE